MQINYFYRKAGKGRDTKIESGKKGTKKFDQSIILRFKGPANSLQMVLDITFRCRILLKGYQCPYGP